MARDLARADQEEAELRKRAKQAEANRRRLSDVRGQAAETVEVRREAQQHKYEEEEYWRLNREADMEAKLAKERSKMQRKNAEAKREARWAEEDARRTQRQPEKNDSPQRSRKTTGNGKPIVLPPPGIFVRNIATVGGRGSSRAKLMRYWFEHAPAFA